MLDRMCGVLEQPARREVMLLASQEELKGILPWARIRDLGGTAEVYVDSMSTSPGIWVTRTATSMYEVAFAGVQAAITSSSCPRSLVRPRCSGRARSLDRIARRLGGHGGRSGPLLRPERGTGQNRLPHPGAPVGTAAYLWTPMRGRAMMILGGWLLPSGATVAPGEGDCRTNSVARHTDPSCPAGLRCRASRPPSVPATVHAILPN